MPRRSNITGTPADHVDEWPDGPVTGPPAAAYAKEIALTLRAAIGERSLRGIAREADIDHTTLGALLSGQRWPDMITLVKLEQALGVRLWPDLID